MECLLACDSEMNKSLAAGGDRIAGITGLVGLGNAIAAEHGLRNPVGTPRSAGVAGSFRVFLNLGGLKSGGVIG